MKDHFSTYHPTINFIFFVFAIGVPMFLLHPVLLVFGILAAFCYACVLQGVKKAVLSFLKFTVPVMVIVALINPMFSHYGVTSLFYLENGNPVTLESMVYGVILAAMFCTVVTWFQCFHIVMTSEKFMYLFGKIVPALSLVLSMCLRFVPRFEQRLKVIQNGQKGIGRDMEQGNLFQKISCGIKTMSIMITWSLEDGIHTADSMKARGYGLKGRTAFSMMRFDLRDARMLSMMVVLVICFFVGCAQGNVSAVYNPQIEIAGVPLTVGSMITYGAYLLFCFLPILVDGVDAWRWKQIRRDIVKAEDKTYRLWED